MIIIKIIISLINYLIELIPDDNSSSKSKLYLKSFSSINTPIVSMDYWYYTDDLSYKSI